MVHRRTIADDARGVGEPLNEGGLDGKGLVQIVRHFVVFGDNYRKVQMSNDQKVSISFVESTSATFIKNSPTPNPFPVPANIKLFFRPFEDGSYLLRLQSFSASSVSVSVPTGWAVTELTLSANQLKSDWDSKRYKWNVESGSGRTEVVRECNGEGMSWWTSMIS